MLDENLQNDPVWFTLFELVFASAVHRARLLTDITVNLTAKITESLSVIGCKVTKVVGLRL